MEVELKLLVSPDGAAMIRNHPMVMHAALSPAREEIQDDTYFDTPDWQVREADASLRVRRAGDDMVQTMKSGDSNAVGLHARHEWESRVAGDAPETGALRKMIKGSSACGQLLGSPGFQEKLAPVFSVHVRRTLWNLQLEQGDEVELALDQGHIEWGATRQPVSEVELELISGNPAHLFEFARTLQHDVGFHIGSESKAARGYRMVASEPAQAVKAKPLTLSKKMTVEEVFQAIALNCLDHVQANQAGVADGRDAESIHQMRVGLRRLSSARRLFEDIVQVPQSLQEELDWLGKQLGAARDWDVLSESTLGVVARELPEPGAVATVQSAAFAMAQSQHEAAARAVSEDRYTRLMLTLAHWIHACGWRDELAQSDLRRLGKSIKPFASNALRRDRQRLLKRGKKLPGADPVARHRVRIAAKRTRYDAEFFRSLYSNTTLRPYLKNLSSLQDELGWLNDMAVADQLLRTLPNGKQELASGASYVRGFLASRIHGEDATVLKRWKKLAPLKLPV